MDTTLLCNVLIEIPVFLIHHQIAAVSHYLRSGGFRLRILTGKIPDSVLWASP